MRAIVLIALALAGCGSDSNVASQDLAACRGGVTAPATATACGTGRTCPPGMICVYHQPGTPVRFDLAAPADGGSVPAPADGHVCVALAPACQSCAGCGDGSQGLPFGCFANICDPYEDKTGCLFDGATLTCINL